MAPLGLVSALGASTSTIGPIVGVLVIVAVLALTPRFFWGLFQTAMRSLDTNFLRSLLATVGVLIGVASVVACMSILEGFSNDFQRRFKSLGSNVLYVMPAEARVAGRSVGASQTLDLTNVTALKRELPDDIERIAPEAFLSALVKRFQKSSDYTVLATTDDYFDINAYKIASGRVFAKPELDDDGASVVMLGAKVAETLFGGADAVGQAVTVRGSSFRVIAVMEKKGNLGFLNADETVFIPVKVGLSRFLNRKWLNRFTILAKDGVKMEDAQQRIKRVLRTEHNIRAGEPDDFNTYKQEDMINEVGQIMMIWKVVFYSIAGISLVVGGIGIMNIMLVSVTERTREIGVRIAVGARQGDILLQFLVEALVISLLGGGFGLLLGSMFADLLEKIVEDFFKTEVSTLVILASLGTSTIVGLISGIYPAFKASRLDPVEALRYE